MILADTNTWVYHIQGSRPTRLPALLSQGRIRTCEVVLGELLLGTGLPDDFRTMMAKLPRLPSPSAAETLSFVERNRSAVAGTGAGWADLQVIITAKKAGALLYTEDRAMRGIWTGLGFRLADETGPPKRARTNRKP